jgi:hypothetical protein
VSEWESDLVLLVADKSIEATVRGVFSRPDALGIRELRYRSFVHPDHDPGCYLRSHDFLRPFVRSYEHALVMFDKHGCGRDELTREQIEAAVTERLSRSEWGDRAAAVVLDPELEVWVWSDSPHVETCLGWIGKDPDLRTWLKHSEAEGRQIWPRDVPKPEQPKAAVNLALRHVRKPRSSAIYEQLARSVSFERCVDPSFARFRELLCHWFLAQRTA